MLNSQIHPTNSSVQIDTVETILAGGVVRGRVKCRVKHLHCATGDVKPGMAGLSLYASPCWQPDRSFEPSFAGTATEQTAQAAALAARSAVAVRQMPAPAWGRLVVLRALSS